MHWVVQNNLLNAADLQALCAELDHQGVSYDLVHIVPFFHIMEPDVCPDAPHVLTMGSTALGKIAREKGWTPGYFEQNLDYRLYLQHYGQHMLNHEAVVGALGDITPPWLRFFVRPVSDRKSFSGTVMSVPEWQDMQANVAKVDDEVDATMHLTDYVVIAPLQDIYAEYRF